MRHGTWVQMAAKKVAVAEAKFELRGSLDRKMGIRQGILLT
jgi:hypothetical protein